MKSSILLSPDAAPAAAAPPAAPVTPAAPPAPPPPKSVSESPFAKLDAKIKLPAPKPAPEPPPKDTPPKETPKDTPPKETPKPAQPILRDPKPLRAELDKVNAELAERNKTLGELQSKIARYEAQNKDTETLRARLEQMEKSIGEKEGELRALKQEASPEFKNKWDKPFFQRSDFVRERVESMTVSDENGKERKATWDDFVYLYRLPTNRATAEAQEMFGPATGPWVVQQITELQRMQFERGQALKEEQAKWKENQDKEQAAAVQQKHQYEQTFTKLDSELSENVPDYHDDPSDQELVDLRKEGYAVFDMPVANAADHILKYAHIRQRVAAFGPMKLTIQRLQAKVSELEAQLKEEGPSVPGKTRRAAGTVPSAPNESWEEGAIKAIKGA